MARFVKGEVVVLPFPFTDLTQAKRRPALVVTPLAGDDVILCQITSQPIKDAYAIPLDSADFEIGSIARASNIRPNRLFTADTHIVLYRVGKVKAEKVDSVVEAIVDIVRH